MTHVDTQTHTYAHNAECVYKHLMTTMHADDYCTIEKPSIVSAYGQFSESQKGMVLVKFGWWDLPVRCRAGG